MIAEKSAVGIPEKKVKFVVRDFQFSCPKCGHLFRQTLSVGHHSTLAAKELKARFPKNELKRLRGLLPVEEREIFRQTLRGKRMVGDEEIERWGNLLNQI
jgi:uncharacterized C2H2 Zn-finger protein